MPWLTKILLDWPWVDTLHFQSDGPTTQYRNKINFCLAATVPKLLGFGAVWWNFSEAGHGKGPAEREREREIERDFYSHKAGNQKGHAHQTWCLLFSNISTI